VLTEAAHLAFGSGAIEETGRPPRLAADRQVLGDRKRREQHEVLVNHRDAEAVRGFDRRNSRISTADRDAAAVGGHDAARICMRVVLPAPFSPTTAWTSPRATSRSTPSSATVAP
jgi:hypothetical protein